MPPRRDSWLDQAAGPVVRAYAVTSGRTISDTGQSIGLIDVILAVPDPAPPAAGPPLGPEHRQVLARCRQRASTLVDLASDVNLAVGVVQVLVSDLSERGLVRVAPTQRRPAANARLLREVLDGLQAL